MKRIMVLILVLALILSACTNKQVVNDNIGKGSEIKQEPVVEKPTQDSQVQEPKEQTQPTPKPTEETPKPTTSPSVKEFTMTAKQFSFDPATIEVNKGDKVRIVVTSKDVPHGIAIPEYGINQRLDVGKPVTIEFTADKQGTFLAFCSVACGAGHGNMKGQIIVK